MTTLFRKAAVAAALLLAGSQAFAQANGPANAPEVAVGPSDQGPPAPAALDPSSSGQAGQRSQSDQPAQPEASTATPMRSAPAGQWVYTQQYGWLWMPYGEAYTHVPGDDYGEPYMYVYGPAVGWTWVAAPWLWGWGPYPYFGVYGPWRFAWYGHWGGHWGWGPRWFAFGPGGHGFRPFGWHGGGVRPAPPRGVVSRGVAPLHRGR